MRITKRVSTLILRESDKDGGLVETEKIASEYSNNRKRLMSDNEVVWNNSKKASFKLCKPINQFLLFPYSFVSISVKGGISWAIAHVLERV